MNLQAEKIEYHPQHLLTRDGMLLSVQVLNKVWENEKDADWDQYLKD